MILQLVKIAFKEPSYSKKKCGSVKNFLDQTSKKWYQGKIVHKQIICKFCKMVVRMNSTHPKIKTPVMSRVMKKNSMSEEWIG